MSGKWVCFTANKAIPRDDRITGREIRSILCIGNPVFRVVSVDGDTEESFLFVRSTDRSVIDRMLSCRFISGVVPSRDCPHHFTDDEVIGFSGSASKSSKAEFVFDQGDLVKVLNGYLKGLYGIVMEKMRSGTYKVFFSFYMRRFTRKFRAKHLEFVGKVLEYELDRESLTNPVVVGSRIVHPVLHRKPSRERRRKKR